MKKFSMLFAVLILLCCFSVSCVRNGNAREDLDPVYFGMYYYSDYVKYDGGRARTQIRWDVISREGDRVYLISDEILECIPYREESTGNDINPVWKDSFIREWLNGDFCDISFTDEEKEYLLEMDITVKHSGIGGSEKSTDKVVLPTSEQIEKLDKKYREGRITDYSVSRNLSWFPGNYRGVYWLLSPASGYQGSYVDVYGNAHKVQVGLKGIPFDCIKLNSDFCGVRPVVCISYDKYLEFAGKK
ncbi:MAG: hypothetical protein IJS94_07225 [Clostridia bacterium]|nr:hypothetical protein [Clostridia bacterium]